MPTYAHEYNTGGAYIPNLAQMELVIYMTVRQLYTRRTTICLLLETKKKGRPRNGTPFPLIGPGFG
jgi:hypothetical protein